MIIFVSLRFNFIQHHIDNIFSGDSLSHTNRVFMLEHFVDQIIFAHIRILDFFLDKVVKVRVGLFIHHC